MDIINLVVFALFSVIFGLCAYVASAVVRYYSQNEQKNTTYECGVEPEEDAAIQFEPKFLIFAVVFLLFEAETVLLLPYALCCNSLGLFGFIEIVLFLLILLFALIFAIKSGILRYL